MTDSRIFDGTTLSLEAYLNGKARVPVRFWEPMTDRELLVDRLDPRAATQRQRVLKQLERRGVAPEGLVEAEAHLEELASAAMDNEDKPATPPATLQPGAKEPDLTATWERCKSLASLPSILPYVIRTVGRLGVAGAGRLVATLYLALVSRLLKRPVSIAIKGPSAVGKSYPVEQTLRLFPAEAYYTLTAMSERALAYSEEPLIHRMLVLYEAAGMSGDFASYLIRSLLSEGRLRYETVEKGEYGLQARLIEREGPTGLIITTTRVDLHPENETRLLSLAVPDTPRQTMAVMRALAVDTETEVDLVPWHALQHWVASGERRVAIPYAKMLAELIPPVAVRLRRDFGMILTLIRAHALLHRANRGRDQAGQIIATLADYRTVRKLVAESLADVVDLSVAKSIRETVQAVRTCRVNQGGESEVTISAVTKVLKLDKSAAWRRVQAAIKKGYLVNNETNRGRPARLVPGSPLPDDDALLPDPRVVENALTEAVQCNPVLLGPEGVTPGVAGLQTDPAGRPVVEHRGAEDGVFELGDAWEPAP